MNGVERVAAVLAAAFVVFGLIATVLLATEMPPYQNADEMNHFLRAEQLGNLGVLPRGLAPGIVGGMADIGIIRSALPFAGIPFRPDRKVTPAMDDAAGSVGWGTGVYQAAFPNTALYPPTCYLPAVIAIRIGKASGRSVIDTLYLARALTGLCATVVAGIAILLAGAAAPWLFAVLSLPMTLSLFAAVSQDGMIIALSALAASLLSGSLRERGRMTTPRYLALGAAMLAVCMARPPYCPLALLLLLAPWRRFAVRLVCVGLVGAATAAWSWAVLAVGGIHLAPSGVEIDPGRQFATIVAHPDRLYQIAYRTVTDHGIGYLQQLIGQLGWLDVTIPNPFRVVAFAMLALAAACCVPAGVTLRGPALGVIAVTLVALIATVVAIFAIQYLVYSAVGAAAVEGVQGRYFIPPLLFVACLFSIARPGEPRWIAPSIGLVAALPLASIAVALHSILVRYAPIN